ncbi:MAG: hypothetical protein QOE23_1029 [Pseudonocardiales bacterium]|nr:hypothetical protein [Pseudonocardiales bacterium]
MSLAPHFDRRPRRGSPPCGVRRRQQCLTGTNPGGGIGLDDRTVRVGHAQSQ